MNSEYKEGEHYEIVESPIKDDIFHCIKLNIEPYRDLIIHFGKVSFPNYESYFKIDFIKMKFDYDILNVDDDRYIELTKDEKFNKILGDLLVGIIKEHFESINDNTSN